MARADQSLIRQSARECKRERERVGANEEARGSSDLLFNMRDLFGGKSLEKVLGKIDPRPETTSFHFSFLFSFSLLLSLRHKRHRICRECADCSRYLYFLPDV